MIPPKYKFYIGKLESVYFQNGVSYDSNTGELIQTANAKSTNYIYRDGFAIRSNVQTDVIRIAQFDKDGNFRGRIAINKGEIYHFPSYVHYVGISFFNISNIQDNILDYKTEVTPHYKDLNKKYAKESGQEFFRVSLDGKINLFGDDYELIKNASLESILTFTIYKYNSKQSKWNLYYDSEFNKTDCKFDYEKRKCELKTTAADSYTEIMNNYDNTYDLIKLAPEISKIDLHRRSLMQVYVRGANSITNFFGGTYWEDDINEAIDSHDDLINKYYFAYIKAGNEFYVNGAGISEVNGVYAGTNGYWSQWNGYTCYMGTETPMVYANIYIKRNSDNTILYKSEKQYIFTEEGNCYIGREDIVMVNVNNSSDKFTIESPFVYHIYRRLLCDVDSVTDSEGVKNTYNLPSDDFVTNNRNYKKCIGLRDGMFFCTSRAVDEPTKYGLNDYGQYFTNQFIPSSTGIGRALPISKNSWANASLWYVYDSFYEYFEKRLRKRYTLKDSYSIGAAIKAILKKIDPNITHEPTAEYSQFLYGGTSPLGLARFYVYITQKTNILKGNYDQPAQKAETSFEELMKMLRDCFRCYWYIEDNKLKIEHIYFFMNGGSYSNQTGYQLDFTKLTDQFNKKLSSYFQSEVEFEKSDLNQRYEFGWMDDVTDLFGGVIIDVKSNYIQKDKTEEINIGQFSSDVDFMLFNPSNFSDDGFALLCAVKKSLSFSSIDFETYNLTGDAGTTYGIRSTSKIAINGDITVTVTDKTYLIIIQAYENNGNYKSTYVYDSASLKNVREAHIWVRRVDGGQISPEDIKGDFYYGPGTIVYDNMFELPIISVENLIDENGDTYKAIAQNWYASWIYLQNFYMWDMPAESISSNVVDTLYTRDVKKCMKHTIEFPSEEDLNELELIKTAFGNGKIDEMSFNINTRQAKVNLLYQPQ